jgi:peptidoglycan-N-acetylglucosamine deacetylase
VPDDGGVTFTLDLEHHWYAANRDRFVGPTEELLALTTRLGVRGTVFVLGEVVESHPGLVRRLADAGHEIALHGHHHTALTELSADEMRSDIETGKALVEAVTDTPCVGYRAPFFSLVPESRRVVGVLAELGFVYSSSVLPVANPQFGWPGAPTTPFRWPEGVIELPVPVFTVAGRGIPYLGGTYLRVLPDAFARLGIRRGHGQLLWTYCHPYDLDSTEPFTRIDRLGHAQSRLLWLRRAAMLRKLEQLLMSTPSRPLRDRVDELDRFAPAPA